jgi:DNA-binding Xre family transcriptional regulator
VSRNITQDDTYHKRMALVHGSIISHVKEVAIERGFRNARGAVHLTRLAREAAISTATLYYLFNHPEAFRQLNLITLAKLCAVLHCQPGDLFTHVPGLSTSALGIDVSSFANLSGVH